METPNPHPNPTKYVTWRIVCETLGGTLYSHELELQITDTGATVMEKVSKRYRILKSQSPYRIWDRYPLFWSPVIEIAVLSTNSSCNLESQSQFCRVFATDRVEDLELTAAFYNPSILLNTYGFGMDNMQIDNNSARPNFKRYAILISLRMNKLGFVALLILNLLLCFGSGVIAGFLSGKFDSGVEVMSGTATVLACLQTLIFLLKWSGR